MLRHLDLKRLCWWVPKDMSRILILINHFILIKTVSYQIVWILRWTQWTVEKDQNLREHCPHDLSCWAHKRKLHLIIIECRFKRIKISEVSDLLKLILEINKLVIIQWMWLPMMSQSYRIKIKEILLFKFNKLFMSLMKCNPLLRLCNNLRRTLTRYWKKTLIQKVQKKVISEVTEYYLPDPKAVWLCNKNQRLSLNKKTGL